MIHELTEWPCSHHFLNRLQQRADTLRTETDRLRALTLSLKHIPFRPGNCWAHYMLLTVAGIYGSQKLRWQLASRLHREDPRPERLATFLITKLKHYRNKLAQIAVALRDVRAVENAIRAGKRWGVAVVSIGRTCIEKAKAVHRVLSGARTRPLEHRSQLDTQRHRDLMRTQLQQAISEQPKPMRVVQPKDMTCLLRMLA
jgi:hypothetical protein